MLCQIGDNLCVTSTACNVSRCHTKSSCLPVTPFSSISAHLIPPDRRTCHICQAPTPVWAVSDSFAAVSVSVSVASPEMPSQSSAPVSVSAVVIETPSVGTEQVAEGGGAISE